MRYHEMGPWQQFSKALRSLYVAVKEKAPASATVSKKAPTPVTDSKPSDTSLTVEAKNNSSDTNSDSSVKATSETGTSDATASRGKYTWHIVQKGDTLYSIAKRYDGMTVDEIKSMNNLNTNELKPGTKLRVKVIG